MGWIIIVIGALCAAAGAYGAYTGYEIIQVERGWAMVIAGSTLFSAGIISLVIGLLALKLNSLARIFARPAVVSDTPKPWAKPVETPLQAVTSVSKDAAIHIATPALAAGAALGAAAVVEQADLFVVKSASDADTAKETPPPANHEVKTDGISFAAAPDLSASLPKTFSPGASVQPAANVSVHDTPPDSTSESADAASAVHSEHNPAPSLDWLTAALKKPPVPEDLLPELHAHPEMHAAGTATLVSDGYHSANAAAREIVSHTGETPIVAQNMQDEPDETEAAPAAVIAHAPAPTVVGRYEAAGTNYAMYSDGSVEAENEHGVFRFGSMSELRAFIEEGQMATMGAETASSHPAT